MTMPAGICPSNLIEDHDVYLLAGSARVNLKFRRRTNTLKLKLLETRSQHGLERWRTEFDVKLPIGQAVAEHTLDLLREHTLTSPLVAASTTDEAVELVSNALASVRLVEADKWRRLYRSGPCLIDDVSFRVGDATFRSIGIESRSGRALRAFVNELATQPLGEPRNYVDFMQRRC